MSFIVRLCGALAPTASIVVGLSPVSTIQQISIERNVGSYPLLPYSTMIINAALWFIYGLLKQNISVWFGNGICLVLGVTYFLIYIRFSPPASSILPGTVQQHIQVVVGMVLAAVLISIFPILNDPAQLIGSVGCIIVVLLFASPLVVLRQVIQSKDARSIPLPFTVACTLNCFLWTVYGFWGVRDFYIYFPNALGLILSVAQLVLKIYYSEESKNGFSKVLQMSEARPLAVV
jgi:solute carrier family 50 (sugar transporter)